MWVSGCGLKTQVKEVGMCVGVIVVVGRMKGGIERSGPRARVGQAMPVKRRHAWGEKDKWGVSKQKGPPRGRLHNPPGGESGDGQPLRDVI